MIFSAWFSQVHSQTKISAQLAGKLVEKPLLITDREIYCVDEEILFSAFNISSIALRDAGWSNVLYVELVSPNGDSFVRKKYSYNEDGTNGSLRIPTSVLTGNYYLRAYTRWMRDYSPYDYFYKMISVINPFRPELNEPTGSSVFNESKEKKPIVNTTDLRIETDNKIYDKREQVNVEISVAENAGFADKFVVSVIPKGTEIPLILKPRGLHEYEFSPDFIPETRGLSISGKVVNAADSVPLAYTMVGLTVFKQNPEIQNVLTNEKGQFFFDLSKLKGEYEIFISAKSNENQTPLILVDNDFSSQKIELPFVPMDFSEESKKLYQSLSFSSQMQALYRQKEKENKVKSFSSDSSFYGTPDFVLKIGDYITLPSIKDYIYELVPQVGVRRDGKKTTLKVLGIYAELGIYDPLVLVDMVPIFDVDKVLALQPNKMERIEVITLPYVRGGIMFGGIVSLFSKNGDLAGIDLPLAGRFITYNMLNSDQSELTSNLNNQRIPNLRNCLYWNPDLKLKGKDTVKISFNTGDNAGKFLIIIRSIDDNNSIGETIMEINVK